MWHTAMEEAKTAHKTEIEELNRQLERMAQEHMGTIQVANEALQEAQLKADEYKKELALAKKRFQLTHTEPSTEVDSPPLSMWAKKVKPQSQVMRPVPPPTRWPLSSCTTLLYPTSSFHAAAPTVLSSRSRLFVSSSGRNKAVP